MLISLSESFYNTTLEAKQCTADPAKKDDSHALPQDDSHALPQGTNRRGSPLQNWNLLGPPLL